MMHGPFRTAALLAALAGPLHTQELSPSGVSGIDLFYATSPSGTSQLYAVAPAFATTPIPLGPTINATPSRWAHRRRVMGALETAITYAPPAVLMTPLGDAPGNGGIHLIDARTAFPPLSVIVPGGNPPAYDLTIVQSLSYVFSAEDNGVGGTTLRGYSYIVPGQLLPLNPPTLDLPGSPSAYVNRMGLSEADSALYVPTVAGVHVVHLSNATVQMAAGPFIQTTPFSPTTNPTAFDAQGGTRWAIGTSRFSIASAPVEAGWVTFDTTGLSFSGAFGAVPSSPGKLWVPAAGTEELAVVGNGTSAYIYYLLREPGPGTFFVKPSAIGVVRYTSVIPATSTIICPDLCGEPFANPAVSGTRVALESSLGPPFIFTPPGGAEKISILYSPLDPLGSGSQDGVLAVAGPLGGRISTKGMDRPLWTLDGTRVISCTSHFPGAPNPGVPGIESLNVPAMTLVDEYTTPHTIVANLTSPNQSIVFPSIYRARDNATPPFMAGLSFVGNVFHDSMASIMALPYGEIGQKQVGTYSQPPSVPNFPAIFPPGFDDVNGSLTAIPASFGARRTTFNVIPQLGFRGIVMLAAMDDRVLIQLAGNNHLASIGFGVAAPTLAMPLPTDWVTTTEFLSL